MDYFTSWFGYGETDTGGEPEKETNNGRTRGENPHEDDRNEDSLNKDDNIEKSKNSKATRKPPNARESREKQQHNLSQISNPLQILKNRHRTIHDAYDSNNKMKSQKNYQYAYMKVNSYLKLIRDTKEATNHGVTKEEMKVPAVQSKASAKAISKASSPVKIEKVKRKKVRIREDDEDSVGISDESIGSDDSMIDDIIVQPSHKTTRGEPDYKRDRNKLAKLPEAVINTLGENNPFVKQHKNKIAVLNSTFMRKENIVSESSHAFNKIDENFREQLENECVGVDIDEVIKRCLKNQKRNLGKEIFPEDVEDPEETLENQRAEAEQKEIEELRDLEEFSSADHYDSPPNQSVEREMNYGHQSSEDSDNVRRMSDIHPELFCYPDIISTIFTTSDGRVNPDIKKVTSRQVLDKFGKRKKVPRQVLEPKTQNKASDKSVSNPALGFAMGFANKQHYMLSPAKNKTSKSQKGDSGDERDEDSSKGGSHGKEEEKRLDDIVSDDDDRYSS